MSGFGKCPRHYHALLYFSAGVSSRCWACCGGPGFAVRSRFCCDRPAIMKTGSLELGGFELEGFVTDDLGLDSFGEEGALGLPVGVACRGGTRAVLAGMKVLALGSNFGAIMIRRKSVIG
jgi:hypothetical protein